MAAALIAVIGALARDGADPGPAAGPTAEMEIVAGTPVGAVIATPPPSAAPTPSSTVAPVAAATPRPTPVPPPPTAPPPAEPVVTPTPPPEPTPPPAEVAVAVVHSPADAVAAFYAAVVDARFDDAYALWSDRMKAAFDREPNLDDRFAATAAISFETIYVASQSADRATVQANFIETYDTGSSRRFVGYWELILVDGRWLLDWPTY